MHKNTEEIEVEGEKIECDGHPIPSGALNNIDILVKTIHQKTILKIIVAGYLDDSPYTEQRILDKINNYLEFINSEEYEKECGRPSIDNTEIAINCDLKPSQYVIDMVNDIRCQVNSYGASIYIEY